MNSQEILDRLLAEKKLLLNFAWGIRLKMRDEGNRLWDEWSKLWAERVKLRAEGNRLWDEWVKLKAEGDKLRAEGDKLWAEGNRLWDEGDKLWADAVLEACGNIKMDWVYEEGKEVCKLETGEVFKRDCVLGCDDKI